MTSSFSDMDGALRERNDEQHENFAKFFQWWLGEQESDLQDLLDAAAAPPPRCREQEEEEDCRLRWLVQRVMSHYEEYYATKSASAKRDVLPMFTPAWTSSTENLFLWVGGWRPSMTFHLLYSKAGLQVEPQLSQLIRGARTRDLADLSPDQLECVDRLQRQTIRFEKEISEEKAAAQETVADAQMVGLAHVLTQVRREAAAEGEVEMMEPEMRGRRERMESVLARADLLRIDTLRGVVEILRPAQAVHFLIAAAELHLRLHEFGKRKDETNAAAAATVESQN